MQSSFFKLKPVRKQELQKALAAPPRPGLVLKKNKAGRNQWMKAHPDEKKERTAKSGEETKQRKDPAFAGFEFFPGGVLGDLSLYSKGAEFASSDGGFYRIEKVADKVLTVALYTMQQGLKLVGGPANINVAAFQALLRKQHADQFNKEFNAGLRARLELESMLGQGATPQQRSRARKEVERWKKVNAGVQSAAKADIKPTAIDESQTIGQTTEGFDTAASGEKLSELQGKKGNTTEVFYPGKEGQPESVAGEYRLVEASDIIPSHDPTTFQANQNYPAGLQERAYHRDKAEQQKVRKNAENFKPGIVVNTNPDALNGPPVVNEQGVVLGGNSRTMSMQLLYKQGGEKAKELRAELLKKAESLGFDPADVKGMKEPVLVRRIEAQGEKQGLLVRQFNESMTQGMDESAQAAAIGRKLSKDNLDALANGIKDDQTLNDFLKSAASEDFVQSLAMSGVIDDRNRNQFVGKDKRLNKKGRELVELALLGKTIDDGDLLAATSDSMKTAIARIAPSLLSAEGAGEDHKMRNDLKLALSAINEMRSKLGKMPEKNSKAVENARLDLDMDFDRRARGEMQHPVNKNERASLLFDTLASKGTVQLSKIFRNYDRLATGGVGGGLFGAPSSVDLLKESIEGSEIQKALEAVFVEIIKGRTTKYLRRWRVTNKKTGKSSWRYAYPSKRGGKKRTRHEGHATEHKRVLGESSDKHYHAGASFAAGKGKGHFIIESVDGKNLTFYLDEDEHGNRGPVQTMSRADFRVLLREEHREEFEKAAMEGLIARQDLFQECLLGGVATERQIELAKAEMLRWHKENKAYLKSDDKKKLNAARGKLFAEATRQGLTKEDLYKMMGVTSLSDKAGQVTSKMLDDMRLRIEAGDFVRPGTEEPAVVEPGAVEPGAQEEGAKVEPSAVEPGSEEPAAVEADVLGVESPKANLSAEDQKLLAAAQTIASAGDSRVYVSEYTQEALDKFASSAPGSEEYEIHKLELKALIEREKNKPAKKKPKDEGASAEGYIRPRAVELREGVPVQHFSPGQVPQKYKDEVAARGGAGAKTAEQIADSTDPQAQKNLAEYYNVEKMFEEIKPQLIAEGAGPDDIIRIYNDFIAGELAAITLSLERERVENRRRSAEREKISKKSNDEVKQDSMALMDKLQSTGLNLKEKNDLEDHFAELMQRVGMSEFGVSQLISEAKDVGTEADLIRLRAGTRVYQELLARGPEHLASRSEPIVEEAKKTARDLQTQLFNVSESGAVEPGAVEPGAQEKQSLDPSKIATKEDLIKYVDEAVSIRFNRSSDVLSDTIRDLVNGDLETKETPSLKKEIWPEWYAKKLRQKDKIITDGKDRSFIFAREGAGKYSIRPLVRTEKGLEAKPRIDIELNKDKYRFAKSISAALAAHLSGSNLDTSQFKDKLDVASLFYYHDSIKQKLKEIEPEASKPGAVEPAASKPGAVEPGAAQKEGAKTSEGTQEKMSVPPKKLGKKQARHDRKMFSDANGQIRSAPNGTADLRAIADRFSDAQISHAARELNKKLDKPLPALLFEEGDHHLDMFARTIKGTLPKKYHKGLGLAQFSMVHEEYVNQKADVLSRVSAGLNPNGTISTSSLASTDMLGRPLMGRAADVSDFDERAVQEVFPEYLADVNDSFRSFDPATSEVKKALQVSLEKFVQKSVCKALGYEKALGV